MSSAIPFFWLISSYSNEQLIQKESEYYQKLIDFTKVFSEKLKDGSITDFDNPMYEEFQFNIVHELHTIQHEMFLRTLPTINFDISTHLISINKIVKEKGLKSEVF